MIDSISPVSVQRSNAVSFKGELPYSKTQSQEKHGMSAAQKTLLGLGALAAVTVGALLAKKHFDTKFLQAFVQKMEVIKPEKFDRSDLLKLIKEDSKKYDMDIYDSIVITPKSVMKKLFPSSEKYFDKLSDNAFMYRYAREDGTLYGVGRFFDPKTIDPKLSELLKKNEAFISLKIESIKDIESIVN